MNQPQTDQHPAWPLRPEPRSPAAGAEVVRLEGYERGERAGARAEAQEQPAAVPTDPVRKLRVPGGLESFVAEIDREIRQVIHPPAPGATRETDHGVAASDSLGGGEGVEARASDAAPAQADSPHAGDIHGEELTGAAQARPEEKAMADEAPLQATPVEAPGRDRAGQAPQGEAVAPAGEATASALGRSGTMRMQLAGERQAELERMEQVMAKVNRGLPAANPTLLDTSEQLDFIRKVGLAIAELDWFAVGDSPERVRLANALMNYRYQLQGLTRDLNRSNKVIAKIRRESAALEKSIESARRVARQLGNSRRYLGSHRDYESELRKVILLQDRLLELSKREAKEQYIRREVMKKAHDMNQELRDFAARLEAHAGNQLGAAAAIGRVG